jgi:hypothetical protein
MHLRWSWEFSLSPEILYLPEGQMFFFCFLRNEGSRMVTMLEMRPVSCAKPLAHPIGRVWITTQWWQWSPCTQGGDLFQTEKKKKYLTQRKGLHFLCSTYFTQRVATMVHLGKFDTVSVYIRHWQTTAFIFLQWNYSLLFMYELLPCLPQTLEELLIHSSAQVARADVIVLTRVICILRANGSSLERITDRHYS